MKEKGLINLFYKKNKINYFMVFIGILLSSACSIRIAFLLKEFLDVSSNGSLGELIHLLLLSLLLIIGMGISISLENFFANRFYSVALNQYKNYICECILKKNISSFNKEITSTYLSALSNDVNSIEMNYLIGTVTLCKQYILFVGGVIAMFYLSWKLAICVISACLLSIAVSGLFGNKLGRMEQKVSDNNAIFMSFIKDMLSGFTVIKSFKAGEVVYNKFANINYNLESSRKKRKDISSIIMIVSNFTSYFITFSVFGVGTYLAIIGEISAGVVIAFIQLLNYILGPIQQISLLSNNKKAAKKLIERSLSYIMIDNDSEKGQLVETYNSNIIFDNVSFGFGQKLVLENINLQLDKGKNYAIVGPSGSGKSTLLNMILGYHPNYLGKITFDSVELRDIRTDSLYEFISTIQQNVFIFDDTIENNIAMYADIDGQILSEVIVNSGLINLINEKGREYKCGENGVNLSGGEKQRISIARSLLRKTSILLMDEGTAALDNNTSYEVENSILNIKGITKIIITHKLDEKLLRLYDEIIVLKDGKIIEKGTFDDLTNCQTYFQSLYKIGAF